MAEQSKLLLLALCRILKNRAVWMMNFGTHGNPARIRKN
jgi:hypothetical protein